MEAKGVASWIECDVSDTPSVEKAFAEVAKKTSVIDVLINNAAIGSIGTIESESDANWEKVFNINVYGLAASHAPLFLQCAKVKAAQS
jgi:NAD(P)-dependent dehydrogenase (short-subunit alcohol dehydrogenase family)